MAPKAVTLAYLEAMLGRLADVRAAGDENSSETWTIRV